MTTADALLQAIIAEPDDNTPRLAYADWLDENGYEQRAEFIRLQIQLSQIGDCDVRHSKHSPACKRLGPGGAGGPFWQCEDLRKREWNLLHDEWPDSVMNNETQWITPLLLLFFGPHAPAVHSGQPRNEGRVFEWEWRRGFIDQIKCSWIDWQTNAVAVLGLQPITRISLTTWPTGYKWGPEPVKRDLERRWPGVKFELPDYPSLSLPRPASVFSGMQAAVAFEDTVTFSVEFRDFNGRPRDDVGDPTFSIFDLEASRGESLLGPQPLHRSDAFGFYNGTIPITAENGFRTGGAYALVSRGRIGGAEIVNAVYRFSVINPV